MSLKCTINILTQETYNNMLTDYTRQIQAVTDREIWLYRLYVQFGLSGVSHFQYKYV